MNGITLLYLHIAFTFLSCSNDNTLKGEKSNSIKTEQRAKKFEPKSSQQNIENTQKSEDSIPKKFSSKNTVPESQITKSTRKVIQTCFKKSTDSQNISLSVPTHNDAFKFDDDRFPTADILESEVVTFDLSLIEGDILPVTRFELDDVAMIVPIDTRIDQVLDAANRFSRTIKIPENAIILFDEKDPYFAEGFVDSGADTTYIFGNKSIFLPGGETNYLKNLFDLGAPLVGHKSLKISQFKKYNYLNGKNQIAFKIFHIAHGHGFVELELSLKPC